jgi:outer membrane protein assembly factor BamB
MQQAVRVAARRLTPRPIAVAATALLLATALAVSHGAAPRAGAGAAKAGAAAPGALPGEWPQWRGPNRDGKSPETGLLQQWPESGPPLAWKAKDLGTGYSSVAVAGGRVYTLGDARDGSYLHALDLQGKLAWSTKVGAGGNQGGGKDYPGTRSTPTVDGQHIYVLGQLGDLACVEAAGGKLVWQKNLVKDFGGSPPEWNYAESPLVDGDRLVCTPGGNKGTLVALNKLTGQKLWQSTEWTDAAQYASVIAADHGGVRQYVQLTMKSVAGVAADTGKLLWKAPFPGSTAVITTPVFHDGHVYVTAGYGVGCALFKINAQGGKFTAQRVYQNKVVKNHHGGVVLHDGKIYGHSDSSGWMCQDFLTGKEVWQEKSKLGKGAIAYADGRFYLREEGGPGTVALIAASPAGYQEHGRFDPPDRSDRNSWPHPVVAAGKLYLRDQDVLLCYDVKGK